MYLSKSTIKLAADHLLDYVETHGSAHISAMTGDLERWLGIPVLEDQDFLRIRGEAKKLGLQRDPKLRFLPLKGQPGFWTVEAKNPDGEAHVRLRMKSAATELRRNIPIYTAIRGRSAEFENGRLAATGVRNLIEMYLDEVDGITRDPAYKSRRLQETMAVLSKL